MLYLGQSDILQLGRNWTDLIAAIAEATKIYSHKDFAQPLKPYLRYRNPANRIIAMPAFIGGEKSTAGIKWIASFPGNIEKGRPRAHSVTILNDADTGVPLSVINTTLVSAIRTAAVSGFFIDEMLKHNPRKNKVNVGISGFGPIGKTHLELVLNLLKDKVNKVTIFDLRPVTEHLLPGFEHVQIGLASRWEDAYADADIFITCTVSRERYIGEKPKPGSLHLNVSLRDYKPELAGYFNHVVVDDWEEVCRENTDIEKMHLEQGLKKEDTHSLAELVETPIITHDGDVVFFSPMGMAVYDIVIARYYYDLAIHVKAGTHLE